MEESFVIRYDSHVSDDLDHIDSAWIKEINRAISTKLTSNPLRAGKPLQHSLKGVRALRVGDYRVAYVVQGTIVTVGLIGHRKNVYQDLV